MVAGADRYFTSSTQRLDCLDRRFCHSTIYLRVVLKLCISKDRLTITEAKRVALRSLVTVLYILNPLDLIPIVGQIDDAAVVAACLLMVRQDLHRYKKWKIANPD